MPTILPILVTRLDEADFSEVCQTLVVNAHGCAMLSPVKLETGIPLRFHTKEGRETTAYVVSCQPVGIEHRSWKLGARLDQPENFWGLRQCPEDWALPAHMPPTLSMTRPSTALTSGTPASDEDDAQNLAIQREEAVFDRVVRQLEPPVKRMIAESLGPLQAEIEALRKKLAYREANPARVELSLTSIPPELEQQVQLRLRKDLGPRALEEARQQYADLLVAAKASIDQRTAKGFEDFVLRAEQQLRAGEERAQAISAQISDHAQASTRRGMQEFQQKLLEGGNSLKRLGEEIFTYLQQNLTDECNARREELERFRASMAGESARLLEQIERLGGRVAKLDETALALESGMDTRLSQMASNSVKDARSQLESLAAEIHQELTARSLKTLGDQLDETTANMKMVQKGVVLAVSECLKAEAADAMQAFDRSMNEMAKRSVERWRLKLAGGLNALAKNLEEEEQPRSAGESDEGRGL